LRVESAVLQNRSVAGFRDVASEVAAASRALYARGLMPATSGNVSAVFARNPTELAVTPSGRPKGGLEAEDILRVDSRGRVMEGAGEPSAETPVHLAIVRARDAGAVVHTHSKAATILSLEISAGLALEGYELLKALSGVRTHEHREWLPSTPNRQDWDAAQGSIEALLGENPECHGFLIRGHGLYTWGEDLAEAFRHSEALEFLLECALLRRASPPSPSGR
jgi:methylthioribulose-1-phosphate dehydratase